MSGDRVEEKFKVEVTYVSRLHIAKKGDGDVRGEGERGRQYSQKTVEGLAEDEIEWNKEQLEELWGKGDRCGLVRW